MLLWASHPRWFRTITGFLSAFSTSESQAECPGLGFPALQPQPQGLAFLFTVPGVHRASEHLMIIQSVKIVYSIIPMRVCLQLYLLSKHSFNPAPFFRKHLLHQNVKLSLSSWLGLKFTPPLPPPFPARHPSGEGKYTGLGPSSNPCLHLGPLPARALLFEGLNIT